jgi:imidazoleglycerol-phosphate dehydratase/histidinol-phosphatase
MPNLMKRVLFIDRDGTIIVEPPTDFQVDSLEKLEFLPHAISSLRAIATELDYELVMVTNQDGLGTPSFPEDTFHPAHNKMLTTLRNEGVEFADILIDRSFAHENKPTRKPGTALLTRYTEGNGTAYDLAASFVIGDRMTDVQLAHNLGAKAIRLSAEPTPDAALVTTDWRDITRFLRQQQTNTGFVQPRTAELRRTTNETDITVQIQLDGTGKSDIHTGIGFFDHLLDQVARHSGVDVSLHVRGDVHIDEHHSIEDASIALGEAFARALGDKRGIERYGFSLLPMDEVLAQVAIDFSGRAWLVWNVEFHREHVGAFPMEMAYHVFKSFSEAAKCTLNIRATSDAHYTNDHHTIEAICKGFARAIKMAIRRDPNNTTIPSTKGVL